MLADGSGPSRDSGRGHIKRRSFFIGSGKYLGDKGRYQISIMEANKHHKTNEIRKKAPANAGRMTPDDLTEIDPSELFDPAEFGITTRDV